MWKTGVTSRKPVVTASFISLPSCRGYSLRPPLLEPVFACDPASPFASSISGRAAIGRGRPRTKAGATGELEDCRFSHPLGAESAPIRAISCHDLSACVLFWHALSGLGLYIPNIGDAASKGALYVLSVIN